MMQGKAIRLRGAFCASLACLGMAVMAGQAVAISVDEAVALSRKTGKPILTVMGKET